MGLFSRKKKTYVNISTSRIIEDRDIRNPVLEGIMSSLGSGANLSESILDYTTHSYATNSQKCYRFANNGYYYYGLPRSQEIQLRSDVDTQKLLKQYLDKKLGKSVTVNKVYTGNVNYPCAVYEILRKKLGYNDKSNSILLDGRVTAYLDDAVITYSNDMIIDLPNDFLVNDGRSFKAGQTFSRSYNAKADQSELKYSDDQVQNSFVSYWVFRNKIVKTKVETYEKVEKETTDADGKTVKETEWQLVKTEESTDNDLENLPNYTSSKEVSNTTDESTRYSLLLDKKYVTTTNTVIAEYTYEYSNEFLDYDYNVKNISTVGDSGKTNYKGEATYISYIYSDGSYLISNLYNINDNSDSELSNIFVGKEKSLTSKFYPRIYFRLEKDNLVNKDKKGTTAYKSSTKMCKRFGLDYASFGSKLLDAIGELDDVESVYVGWGVRVNDAINKNDQDLLAYLYNHFTYLAETNADGKSSYRVTDNTIDQNYEYSHITIVKEQVDDVASHNKFMGVFSDFEDQMPYKRPNIMSYKESMKTWKNPDDYNLCHKFSYTDDTGLRTTVKVYNLNCAYQVSDGYWSTSSQKDENVVIPLDIHVIKTMRLSLKVKNILHAKAFLIYVSTLKVVKQKWYQTVLFKIVLIIIIIVIAYFNPPAGGWTAAAVASAIGMAVIVNIALNILIHILIRMGVAPSIVVVVAIVATLVITALGGDGTQALTAVDLLNAVNSGFYAFTETTKARLAESIEKFNAEMVYIADKQQEVQTKQEEINKRKSIAQLLNITAIQANQIVLGETPDNFLDRTTMVNVGGTTLDYIYNYVAINQTLDKGVNTFRKLQQSLNEEIYI